jgi:DNA-binding SARP family transcriptional activator
VEVGQCHHDRAICLAIALSSEGGVGYCLANCGIVACAYRRGVLEIGLIGEPRVRRDGVPVAPPRGHKVWALLSYLVLHDRPVARTRVAALLFPEANDPLASVRWNLHELRRLLGEGCGLRGDPAVLRLPADAVLDVVVLRSGSWRQAALVTDPAAELLQGLSFPGCPRFEAWLTAQRRHLRSVAEAVMHESVLARLAAGQADQAVATAAMLVQANPYHEGSHELYVRCLVAAGDLGGAVRQQKAAVSLIRRELAREPRGSLLGACEVDEGVDADAVQVRAWSNLGLTWLHAGSFDAGLTSMRRAVAAARRAGDRPLLLRALLVLGYGLAVSSLGGGAEAATVQHQAIALAHELDDRRALGTAELQYAMTELLRGQYSRSLHWTESGAGRLPGNGMLAGQASVVRGTAMVDTGRYAEGGQQLEATLDEGMIRADPCAGAFGLSTLGKSLLLRGEAQAAIAPLERAIELSRLYWVGLRPWPEVLRAEAELCLGRVERAEVMFQQAYAHARGLQRNRLWEGATLRGLGLVAAARGAVGQAVARLDEACAADSYQWVPCSALDDLCELAIANGLPGAPAWVARLEELAGRYEMRGLLERSFQHREHLG